MDCISDTNNDYCYAFNNHIHRKEKDEELTRKVLEDMKREEQIYQQNEDDNSYRKNMPNANEDEYPW